MRIYSLLDDVKNTLHIQIHHLGEHFLWVRVELLAPRRTRIGKQDVDMVRCLRNFRNQSVQLFHTGAIRRHRDGLGTGPFAREGIQGCNGFITGLLLARSDVDLGAAGL